MLTELAYGASEGYPSHGYLECSRSNIGSASTRAAGGVFGRMPDAKRTWSDDVVGA